MPGIGLAVEGELQPLPQRAPPLGVLEDALLHVVEPDARDVMHGALQVPAFLAIELKECARVLEDGDARKALWERLQFALDGEPDPWKEPQKAGVDLRQFAAI